MNIKGMKKMKKKEEREMKNRPRKSVPIHTTVFIMCHNISPRVIDLSIIITAFRSRVRPTCSVTSRNSDFKKQNQEDFHIKYAQQFPQMKLSIGRYVCGELRCLELCSIRN